MEQGVHAYFQTPMAYYYNTDLIDDLKSYILSLETKGIDSNVSVNIKHNLVESNFGLFLDDTKVIKDTANWIGRSIRKTVNAIQQEDIGYNIQFNESWYHITKTNGMHEPHTHPSCSWCGVFYIQSGDKDSGHTVFNNPITSTYIDRGNLFLNNISTLRVPAEDGKLILFPSYLSHYQSLYKGTDDRIVVAFNASVGKIERPKNNILGDN